MGLTIAIVVTFGVLLMILETFIPGMIAGILGVLCVLAGVALVMVADDFSHLPDWQRTLIACGIIVAVILFMLIWMRCFAVKIFHRTFPLQATVPSLDQEKGIAPGTEGTALTELRPLGRAEFAGKRHEVRCEDGFAPAGSLIRVSGFELGNLLVRLRSQPSETPSTIPDSPTH